MADENNNYKLQINSNINGDLVNMRGTSGEELDEVVAGFAEKAPSIFKNLGDIKTAALANGVFSGSAGAPGGAPKAAPAPSAGNTPPGQQPNCDRCGGATKDLRGKRDKQGNPYRNRYYCKNFSCKGGGWGDWIE